MEDFLGVIENDVNPAPLLKDGGNHAEPEHLAHPRFKQVRKTHLLHFLAGERGFDVRDSGATVLLPADSGQNGASTLGLSILCEPARALRHEHHAEKEQKRWDGGQPKHPTPALLAKPRVADKFIGRGSG